MTKARRVLRRRLHPKTLLRERGFRLGFVHHCPRPGGSGLYHYASILYHLTTARGLGSGARSVSENSDTKFEFAVQDAIKTPQAKAPPTRDTFAMRMTLPQHLPSTDTPVQSSTRSSSIGSIGTTRSAVPCTLHARPHLPVPPDLHLPVRLGCGDCTDACATVARA